MTGADGDSTERPTVIAPTATEFPADQQKPTPRLRRTSTKAKQAPAKKLQNINSVQTIINDAAQAEILREIVTPEGRQAVIEANEMLDDARKQELQIAMLGILKNIHEDAQSTRTMREQHSKQAFIYLWVVTSLVFLILIWHSVAGSYAHLPSQVLVVLAGGTFASAVGLVGFAIRGLFLPGKDNLTMKIVDNIWERPKK
ncbi:hypothetical protein [Azospirillum sp. sgz301742]